jgi:starch phosphorylase
MNGVLNLSVLDGWWYEGYREGAGWALTEKRTYDNQQYQDQLDAATIYHLFENEIIPLYFAKGDGEFSQGWVRYIKNSMSQIAPDYTMKRMIDDYFARFYTKLANRFETLAKDGFAQAKEISEWKKEVEAHWDSFTVESIKYYSPSLQPIVGQEYSYEIIINRNELKSMLGIDLVYTRENPVNKEIQFISSEPFKLVKEDSKTLHFEIKRTTVEYGNIKVGFRVYPYNEKLPHRMDFAYVRWIQAEEGI